MSVGGAIRRFLSGVFLLLLAVFILGAVSYVASLIPDSPGSPDGVYYEVLDDWKWDGWLMGVGRFEEWRIWDRPLSAGASEYIVVVTVEAGADYVVGIEVWAVNDSYIRLDMKQYGPNVVYGVVPHGVTFNAVTVVFNTTGRHSIVLLRAPAFSDPVKVVDAYLKGVRPRPAPPLVSGRLIAQFVAWAFSVVLTIVALRRLGLSI